MLEEELRRLGGHYVKAPVIWESYVKSFVRAAIPSAAILLPMAFFLSVLRLDATEPNGSIALAYVGAAALAASVVVLGVGLLRKPQSTI